MNDLERLVKRIITFGETAEQTWTVPKTDKTRKANRDWHAKRFLAEIESNYLLKSDVVRAITKTREIYLTSNTARQRKSADITANDWEVLRELILKDLGL